MDRAATPTVPGGSVGIGCGTELGFVTAASLSFMCFTVRSECMMVIVKGGVKIKKSFMKQAMKGRRRQGRMIHHSLHQATTRLKNSSR